MAFKLERKSPVLRMVYFNAPASTAFTANSLVAANDDTSTTTFIAATASTNHVLGIVEKTVASTDSDYASIKQIPLLVDEFGVFLADVGTGTPTANYVQHYIDLKDASNLDVTASAKKIFFITEFVSATQVRGNIVKWFTTTVA